MNNSVEMPILWYFADPMCSWCWGFSPAINQAKEIYSDRVRFSLNLGGLRPGTTEPISEKMRKEIIHHWQDVHRLSGQPIKFDDPMPDGFVYDTEPASRAVLVFGKMKPTETLEYFTAIQSAFYAQGRNITQIDVLADVAIELGADDKEFRTRFESDEMRSVTQQHFQRTREAGVRGFPTVFWQEGETVDMLNNGYVPYEMFAEYIENKLQETSKEKN